MAGDDFLTGYGASSVRGGLDALLRLCGLEGKGDVSGKDVQELWENRRLEEIDEHCRRDVLGTYLLFLRVQIVRGLLPASAAEQLTKEATASIGD